MNNEGQKYFVIIFFAGVSGLGVYQLLSTWTHVLGVIGAGVVGAIIGMIFTQYEFNNQSKGRHK